MKDTVKYKISPASFSQLLSVIETTDKPLGELCNHLWGPKNAFQATHLAVGASIAALLQDDLLAEAPSRLVAIYVLYDMIVSRPSNGEEQPKQTEQKQEHDQGNTTSSLPSNTPSDTTAKPMERLVDSPLTIILFELIERGDARPPEQLFLSHLLGHSQSNSGSGPVPGQISKAPAEFLWGALEGALQSGASVPKLNTTSLRKIWTERHPESDQKYHKLKIVSGVVPDPETFTGASEKKSLVEELDTVVTLEDFTPSFVRIPPPLLPLDFDNKELKWIDPEPLHELIWDPEMGMKGERGSELRELISKALKSPLPEAQQLRVLAQLEQDAKLVHLCGLSPQKLPDLVENNSALATEILLKLVDSNQMAEYFSALVNMDMNMHSMEVVNRLMSSVSLPTEFVHTYITNCIKSCANILDKYAQVRMVRFVCVFLKNLIKNKIIKIEDLHIEVQAFCIEYSRIREVADLFRYLRMHNVQQ